MVLAVPAANRAKAARARHQPDRERQAMPQAQPPRTRIHPPTDRAAPMARADMASLVALKAATAPRAIRRTKSREKAQRTPETGRHRGHVAPARNRRNDATTRDVAAAWASAMDAAGAASPATPPWQTNCALPWVTPSGWARKASDEAHGPDGAPKELTMQGMRSLPTARPARGRKVLSYRGFMQPSMPETLDLMESAQHQRGTRGGLAVISSVSLRIRQ